MRVLFLYKYLPHYRVEFFQKLREELGKYDIELSLIYGKSKDNLRREEVDIAWAHFVPNKELRMGKFQLIWQSGLKYTKDVDMIIVQPELKLAVNYYFMLFRKLGKYKLGFWGHGRNMQGKIDSLTNRFNNLLLNNCDWWFAYTKGVRDYLISHNYPKSKITVVQNSIDTFDLKRYYHEISESEVHSVKNNLGITGDNTAIYCGGMYPEKKLDFILQAAFQVRKKIFDFNLILIGAGIDAYKAEKAAGENDWIHYIGPKFGKERVIYFKIAVLQLMPGLVGLGILDSFAMETPMITTAYPYHSPEIDYLENWGNGIITENNLEDYVKTVIEVLKERKYFQLTEGCKKSSELYTVQKMVENFREGILSCIGYKNKVSQSSGNYPI